MALVVKDRVKETTTTTGTGTITLLGAVSGYQAFSAIGNANTTFYAIVDVTAGTWEVGIGTYTSAGTTLSRTTVLESSNAGSLVNFAAGSKDVFCTYPAEYAVFSSNNPGTSGYVLTSTGANTAPTWQDAASPVVISTTAPVSPSAGDLWWDDTAGKLKIYYVDANSAQWVDSTVNTSTSGLNMIYPSAGVAVSTGSAWGTSKTTPSGDIVGTTDTQTLTNKRINPRVVAASSTSGNLTIDGDTTDVYKAEGLTGAITFLQPSGTPVDGQKLMIRLEDNGTGRGITWTITAGAFRAVGITLPTTTVASKVTYVGCVYNSTDSFWDVVATVTQA